MLILAETVDFLRRCPPFQFLQEGDLEEVAQALSVEFYPKGTMILRQDGPPSNALRIIKKGSIKVSLVSPDGGEVVLDYRGEGESFGFMSMVGQDRVRSNIRAVEDTICYTLPKEEFIRALDSHRSFTEYFLKSHLTRYIDRTLREIQSKSHYFGGGDRLLFTTRVEDVAADRRPVAVPTGTTASQAARIMTERRITALVLNDPGGRPAGILTDADFREKVVGQGRGTDEPAERFMTSPIISVPEGINCFEAMEVMLRHNINHVLVEREGAVVGIVNNHDLMSLQGSSPLSLIQEIGGLDSLEGLAAITPKMTRVIGLLLKEGAKAGNITKIISELTDRLVVRMLVMAERKFGPPPVPYCWIVFGSEGRKEQTFKTDQDNALIIADAPAPELEAAAASYFGAFTAYLRESLAACGFPPCPGGYMASNPAWRLPLRTWKRSFSAWVATPTPEALMRALTFFDFRPVHGDLELANSLRSHLCGLLKDNKVFLGHLANMAIRNTPPVGFLKSFVVERDGEHKDELNIKVKGIALLVDVVRLFALEKGVRETPTLERIEQLRPRHATVAEYAAEMEYALELFMLMRIQHQSQQIAAGRSPDNFINPAHLTALERNSIKDAFRLIGTIQDSLLQRYKPLIV
jgi:CBS domain-containing protein